ncbi:MAG: hypothetical protein O3C57_07090 [Verrucomicrobia bacterium]|nr:hypothetical protein [Verrucomicrobiota bacterium]
MIFNPLTLSVNRVAEIRRLPDTWPVSELRRLLDMLDIDDANSIPDADVEGMAIMALQDQDAVEAMRIVLVNFSDNRFNRGQIQNLREELKESGAWEDYPEIKHQRALYVCVDLLSLAFPSVYPEPGAIEVALTMTAHGLGQAHARHPLNAATLLRAMGRSGDQTSILNRLFSEQIAGTDFPEAESAIWGMDVTDVQADVISTRFHASAHWFRGLHEGAEGSCTIDWPDET